jgi:hypothetical protein
MGGHDDGQCAVSLLCYQQLSHLSYAKALPPETTSNSAGGFWLPYSLFDADRETPAFHQQYLQSVKFSYTYFQQFAGDDYSVRWLPTFVITDEGGNYAGKTKPLE